MNESELFEAARCLFDPCEREAFLVSACRGDAVLRGRIEALIALQAQAGEVFDKPADAGSGVTLEARTTAVPSIPSTSECIGDRIGHYKLLQKLGEGGCGVVYMAEQAEPIRRRVALKVIKLGMDTRDVIARFEAERQALALMDHPHIAKVLDAGTTDAGRPYFVMELVRGVKFTEFCDQQKMPTAGRLRLFAQVCHAVQHAHQKGIIHRDLKPSNILVTLHDGVPVPKVIDFGIAKATSGQRLTDKTLFTAFEQFMGTPAYMSPEQAEMSGLDIDTRSDIYSLGVLLYEVLTGRTPFDARELLQAGFDEMRRTIREREPARPSTRLSTLVDADQSSVAAHHQTDAPKLVHLLRGDLDWIVMKCLEKDRNRRYETANGLAADLQRHLQNEPVLARPPTATYRARKFIRKHRRAVTAAAAFIVLLLAAVVASVTLARQAHRERGAAVLAQGEARLQENRALAARDGEAASRLDAETQRDRALQAEQQATAIQQFLLTRVIQVARPEREAGGLGRDITVREALAAAEPSIARSFGRQPIVEAAIRLVLGQSYLQLGEPARAVAQLEQARALHARRPGLEPKAELALLSSLATAYQSAGRRADYLETMQTAWQLATNAFGSDAPESLRFQGSLGVAYRDAERYAEAIQILSEGLQRAETSLGPEDLETLNLLNHLSFTYYIVGRPAAAIPLMERILTVRERTLGPEHNETTRVMVDLARAYQSANRWTNAQPLFETAHAARRRVNGADNGITLIALDAYATALDQAGLPAEAEIRWRESVRLRERKFGADHPATLQSIHSLGHSLEQAGRSAEAAQSFAQAYKGLRARHGLGHAETLRLLADHFEAFTRLGQSNDVRLLLDEAAAGLGDADVPNAAVRADALQRFSRILAHAGRTTEAEQACRRALAAARLAFTNSPASVGTAVNALTELLLHLDRGAEAEALAREALAEARQRGPAYSVQAEDSLHQLADLLRRRQQFSTAEPLQREILQRLALRASATNSAYYAASANLAGLLSEWAWNDRRLADRAPALARTREAELLLRAAVTARGETARTNDLRLALLRSRLGFALVAGLACDPSMPAPERAARLVEAERLLAESHAFLTPRRVSAALRLEAATRLVRIYELWNEFDPAAREKLQADWQARVATLAEESRAHHWLNELH